MGCCSRLAFLFPDLRPRRGAARAEAKAECPSGLQAAVSQHIPAAVLVSPTEPSWSSLGMQELSSSLLQYCLSKPKSNSVLGLAAALPCPALPLPKGAQSSCGYQTLQLMQGLLCSCDPFGGTEACRDLPGTAGRGLRGQQHLQQPLCTAGAPRCVPNAPLLQNTGCPQPSINVGVAEVGTAARRKQELNDRRVLLRLKGAWQIAPLQPEMSSPPGEGQHRVRLGQRHPQKGRACQAPQCRSAAVVSGWQLGLGCVPGRFSFAAHSKARPGPWVLMGLPQTSSL